MQRNEKAKFDLKAIVWSGRGKQYIRGPIVEIREPTFQCQIRAYRVQHDNIFIPDQWFWEHRLKLAR